jgi:hypothetical protein
MRGSVVAVLAVSVAAAISPASASGSPAGARPHGPALDHVASTPWRLEARQDTSPSFDASTAPSPRAAVRRWMADQRVWLPKQAAPAASSQQPPESALSAVGPLGGRHRADVIDARTVITSAGRVQSGLTARVGRTGRQLWRRTFPDDDGVEAIPARVGAQHQPGLIVVSDNLGGRTQRRTTFQERTRALSGATGATLWTHTFNGAVTFHGRARRITRHRVAGDWSA